MKARGVPVSLVLACVLACANQTQAKYRVFVANATDDTVSVVDSDLDREVKAIQVGQFPQGFALRQDPPLLAVANSGSNSLTLIDPMTLDIVEKKIRVGRFPVDVEFSADGQYLFSSSYDDATIAVVDVKLRKEIGEPIRLPSRARRLMVGPKGKRLFAVIYAKPGRLAVVDPSQRLIEKMVPVGDFPTDLALSPDGKQVFVAAFNSDTLTVVDLPTLKVEATYDFSVGNGLLIHPVKPLLYSLDTFENRVWVFDYVARKHVADIPIGQEPLYSALTSDGRFLYAVNGTDGNVMKIDTETNKVLLKIAVGVEPSDAVVFDMPSRFSHAVSLIGAVAAVGLLAALGILLRRSDHRR